MFLPSARPAPIGSLRDGMEYPHHGLTGRLDRPRLCRVRVCVIFNPVARGEKARLFRKHLNEIASQATLASTSAPGDARRLAGQAVRQGFDTIVAAGGDGTLNEVLNGIVDSCGLDSCRLGVLPLGTVNVFARELGIPSSLHDAWNTILHGKVRQVDLPAATSTSDSTTRHFAQLAGAGFDAQAIECVNWRLKKRIGPLAYVVAGLRCMQAHRCDISVVSDHEQSRGQLVLIGNGRLYGGSYPVFHDADLTDGLLDVVVFPRVNWITLARCGPSLLLRRELPRNLAHRFKAKQLTLDSSARAPYEVDGELAGVLPVRFAIRLRRLSVLAGP